MVPTAVFWGPVREEVGEGEEEGKEEEEEWNGEKAKEKDGER